MRAVVQRVSEAKVTVEKKTVGEISTGFLVLLGISHEDTKAEGKKIVEKILRLRIFHDESDEMKMSKSILDVGGSILVVSQFTLFANCKKGNRPSFMDAAGAEQANELYEYAIGLFAEKGIDVQTGVFGAYMSVSLINDGPTTIWLDTANL